MADERAVGDEGGGGGDLGIRHAQEHHISAVAPSAAAERPVDGDAGSAQRGGKRGS
jgi:hypothetical protein